MKHNNYWIAYLVLALSTFAFSTLPSTASTLPIKPFLIKQSVDTTIRNKKAKSKKDYTTGELDIAMKDLDKAMLDIDKNIKIDFTKMDKELKKAMEEIKNIDFGKIGRDVESSLKNIDWDKTKMEIDKAMQKVEIKIKEVDVKKIQKELEKVKEEMKSQKLLSEIDLEKIKNTVQESLSKAKMGIEKAKKELMLLKEFTNNLEKDGLIDKKKSYQIEIKSGELYINGTKQSKEVTDKYRKYFTDEDFKISSEGDNGSQK